MGRGGGLLINFDIFTQWCSHGGRLNASSNIQTDRPDFCGGVWRVINIPPH